MSKYGTDGAYGSRTDVSMKNGYAAGGCAMTFRCARCNQFKLVTGRKLKRVGGARQYVCAACGVGAKG